MSRRTVIVLLTVLVSAAAPARLAAWGAEGHEIICGIAWQRFTPQAKELIKDLLSADRDPERSFSESCTWADRVRDESHRSTAPYHFMNVARGARGIDLDRDCPAYDCAPIAIRRYAVYLASAERSRDERAEALKFLGHFVGDLHQPLHVAFGEDRGGNEIPVEWFGKRHSRGDGLDLHRVWDWEILNRAKLDYPHSVADLARGITESQTAARNGLDVVAWADESYLLAVEIAYDLPGDGKLGEVYFERARPVVEEQLRKAGLRLAHLVNALLDGTYDPARMLEP